MYNGLKEQKMIVYWLGKTNNECGSLKGIFKRTTD